MSASPLDLKLHVCLLVTVWPALCKATGKATAIKYISEQLWKPTPGTETPTRPTAGFTQCLLQCRK